MGSLDPRIVDIDGYIHIICGKVICFSSDVYDLSKPEDQAMVIDFAEALYVDKIFPAYYGKHSVCLLSPPCREGTRGEFECYHINQLPNELQHKIRSVCSDYNE